MRQTARCSRLALLAWMLGLATGCVFDTSGINPPVQPSSPTFRASALIERDVDTHRVPNPPPFRLMWSCESCGTGDLNGDLQEDSADVDLAVDTLLGKFINDEIRSNHSSVRVLNKSSFFNGGTILAPSGFSVTQLNNPPSLGGRLGSTVVIPGSTSGQNLVTIDMDLRVGNDTHHVVGQTSLMGGLIQFYLSRLYTSVGSSQAEERLVVTGMTLMGNDFYAVVDGHKLLVSQVSLISYQPFQMVIGSKLAGITSGATSWEFYKVQPSPLFLSMSVERLGPVRTTLDVNLPFQFNLDFTASPNALNPPPFQAKMSFSPKDMKLKGEGGLTVELSGSWENRAPIAEPGPNSVETCLADGVAPVTLNASATQDFDGQTAPLRFMWIKDYNLQGKEELLSIQKTDTVTLPVGTHEITLFVWDDQDALGQEQKQVTVEAKPPAASLSVKPANVKVAAAQFGKMLNFDTTVLLSKYCNNLASASLTVCGDLDPRSQYNNDPSQNYDVEINGINFPKQKCGSVNLPLTPSSPVALKLRRRNDGANQTFKYKAEVRVQDTGGAVGSAQAFVVMTKAN